MFQLTIRFVAAALVVLSASANSAELEAPLGLQWGQTQKQLKAKGFEFNNCSEWEFQTSCLITNPPKSISFARSYVLYFHPGLQQATVVGDYIFGGGGKKHFANLKQRLTVKYGKPNGWAEQSKVGWKLGDAGIVLSLVKSENLEWVRLEYYSKDAKRLLDEAKARQDAADDAGL